ncbi:MAG: hypothetical protein H0X34_20215 [Chthoniobacterales bacterium]|nr:hypothetical protein [Chthoniobacterales bacterium]
MKKNTEHHQLNWNGLLLEITYEPSWLPAFITGEDMAQIQVRSLYPAYAPFPIAPTGFYQHALAASIIDAAGGPVAYIDVMLAAEGGA